MKDQEHLDVLFEAKYHSDINAGINRARDISESNFGFLANNVNITFTMLEPYLDPEKYNLGSSGRRELIKAFALCDAKLIREGTARAESSEK